MLQPTERFSNRVSDYVKYRPSYPSEVITLLIERCGLTPEATVADIGSGTGIFTSLLLKTGATVYAVEPNGPMRAEAEQAHGSKPNFHSVSAPAEATTLEPESIDLITAAQAFHWFDVARTRTEFRRLLRPNGQVALIWNERRREGSPLLQAFEELLKVGTAEYEAVNMRRSGDAPIDALFAPLGYEITEFPNHQILDHDAFLGRVFSSSYAPAIGQPGHEELKEKLNELFDTHQVSGTVELLYTTKVYHGPLTVS